MVSKDPTTKSVQVQTVLRVVKNSRRTLIVSDRSCQTVVSTSSKSKDSAIIPYLEFVPFSEIEKGSLKILDLPRKVVLQFNLEDAASNPTTDSIDISSFNRLLTLIQSSDDMFTPLTDKQVQTTLSVWPYVLDEDGIAKVRTELSIQTSITFDPEKSPSDVVFSLKTPLHHTTDYFTAVTSGREINKVVAGAYQPLVDLPKLSEICKICESDVRPHAILLTEEEFNQRVKSILDNTITNVYASLHRLMDENRRAEGSVSSSNNPPIKKFTDQAINVGKSPNKPSHFESESQTEIDERLQAVIEVDDDNIYTKPKKELNRNVVTAPTSSHPPVENNESRKANDTSVVKSEHQKQSFKAPKPTVEVGNSDHIHTNPKEVTFGDSARVNSWKIDCECGILNDRGAAVPILSDCGPSSDSQNEPNVSGGINNPEVITTVQQSVPLETEVNDLVASDAILHFAVVISQGNLMIRPGRCSSVQVMKELTYTCTDRACQFGNISNESECKGARESDFFAGSNERDQKLPFEKIENNEKISERTCCGQKIKSFDCSRIKTLPASQETRIPTELVKISGRLNNCRSCPRFSSNFSFEMLCKRNVSKFPNDYYTWLENLEIYIQQGMDILESLQRAKIEPQTTSPSSDQTVKADSTHQTAADVASSRNAGKKDIEEIWPASSKTLEENTLNIVQNTQLVENSNLVLNENLLLTMLDVLQLSLRGCKYHGCTSKGHGHSFVSSTLKKCIEIVLSTLLRGVGEYKQNAKLTTECQTDNDGCGVINLQEHLVSREDDRNKFVDKLKDVQEIHKDNKCCMGIVSHDATKIQKERKCKSTCLCTTSADEIYVAEQSELPSVTDNTDKIIPSKFDEASKLFPSKVTSQAAQLFKDKRSAKPKPFVFDSSYHSSYESYLEEMHLLYAKYKPCGSKIEIPWEDIVLQPEAYGITSKSSKEKGVASDFTHHLVKTVSKETRFEDLSEGETSSLIKSASIYDNSDNFDVEISFKESESNIMNVDGVAAVSQRTLSSISTISDLRMQIKRCPKDFIITVHTVDGGIHQVHGGTELKTIGSQPFEVTTFDEYDDPRVPKFVINVPGNVDTIQLIDEGRSDYSTEVTDGAINIPSGESNSSSGNESPTATILSKASEPDSIKSEIEIKNIELELSCESVKISKSNGRTSKQTEEEEFFRISHKDSLQYDLKTSCHPCHNVENTQSAPKPAPKVHRGIEKENIGIRTLKSKSETGDLRRTRTDSILDAIKRHCCDMKPLHEKLDVLKEKVDMNLPNLKEYLEKTNAAQQKNNESNYVSVIPCSFMFPDYELQEQYTLTATDQPFLNFCQVPEQVDYIQDDFTDVSCPQNFGPCICFGQNYVTIEDVNQENSYWQEIDVQFDYSNVECTSTEESSTSSHSSTTLQDDSSKEKFYSDSKLSDKKLDSLTSERCTHPSCNVDNTHKGRPTLVKIYQQQCKF